MPISIFSNSIEMELELAINEIHPFSVDVKPAIVHPAHYSVSDFQAMKLSIMSYELKFSPNGHYSHLKPNQEHHVYDPKFSY